MTYRDLISDLDSDGEVEHVEKGVSTEYEIASKLKKSDKVLLFENVKNHNIKVAGNVYGSRERIAKGLGIDRNNILRHMRESLSNLEQPSITSDAPVKEIVEDDVNLEKYPILKHFEKDGGPYVTSSIFVAKDSEGNRNLSFHRLKLLDKNRFAIRLVPRDLENMFRNAERSDESLDVVAFLGVSPGVALAAATSPDYETDEYGIAGALSKDLQLVECDTVNLEVPAKAEIALEGELVAKERAPEGPFADITETYDSVRQQPVFKVKHITRRENTIYPALLPGSAEHKFLMGMPREPLIFEKVNEVANSTQVALTSGGCGWLHAVIGIKKKEDDDGKKAIEAAFDAHSSLKHVVIVDEDIDVYDSEDVEWAIATRFRGDRDTVIKSDVEGSSLDPTADPETRLGCKTGLDATIDLNNPEKFEKARIPK